MAKRAGVRRPDLQHEVLVWLRHTMTRLVLGLCWPGLTIGSYRLGSVGRPGIARSNDQRNSRRNNRLILGIKGMVQRYEGSKIDFMLTM